ncbi:MAG: tRNA uridine-5-carboxymethylaminomethyl(34) synthesis GTPase MnmE [Wenzhouxiangella sp.]
MIASDTICAIATPSGRGGVGIVRLSGPDSFAVVERLSGPLPPLRQAGLRTFRDASGESIDSGLVLAFRAPASFTGEDVVELHTHGSPVVLDMLMRALVKNGARRARPGEFSERAFLNDRLDLAQAEAIADLINASSAQAARAAHRSLAGALSTAADELAADLTRLRVWVEAALDFPDEDVDFLADGQVLGRCQALQARLADLQKKAHSGRLLNDGIRVAIIGPPNAGKSSLLNALSQREAAIVTDIPGTTRDVLTETVSIAGLAITLADTAGLRTTDDQVEAEGVRRAEREMHAADLVFWVIDASAPPSRPPAGLGESVPFIRIVNKIDLLDESPSRDEQGVRLSIRNGLGLELLADCVRDRLGLDGEQEGEFSARARHVEALERAAHHLDRGTAELEASGSGELLAEELRLAADSLGDISGRMSSDELLGEIFSSFCIGK